MTARKTVPPTSSADSPSRTNAFNSFSLRRTRAQQLPAIAPLAQQEAQFISGMDSDDISLPERLQMQVDFLQSHPEIGAVGVGVAIVDEAMTPRNDWSLHERHAIIVFEMITGGPAINRNTIMVRRHLLLGADGINSAFRIGSDSNTFYASCGQYRSNTPTCGAFVHLSP